MHRRYLESDIEIDTDTDKDGMAVTNQIYFKILSTCKNFAMAFMSRIGNMVSRHTEVRLIFDRYLEQSLKARTKEARRTGVQIRYSKTSLF